MEKLSGKTKVVRFEDLLDKLKKKAKALSTNPIYVKETLNNVYSLLEELEKLKRKKFLQVELKIPTELAEKLGKGKILRVGEIIQQGENRSLAKLLVETKPSNVKKFLKTKNIAFKTVYLMESVLLDRKLEDITAKVAEIDGKLDAQNRGALKSAVQQMKELPLIQNPDTRKSKILFIQDKLSHCEHVFSELYESKWKRYTQLKSIFEKSVIFNKKEFKEMCEIGEKLPGELEPIILCKVGQVKLYEMQEEFVLAQEKAFEAVKYVSEKLEDFKGVAPPTHSRSAGRRSSGGVISKIIFYCMHLTDISKEKTLLKLKDRLLQSNEHIEYLLNTTLSFALTVPEEVTMEPAKKKGFLNKIFPRLKNNRPDHNKDQKNEEVNMKKKKTNHHAPRYAVRYLKPQKGKYLYHVIVTTILLFVVTIIYTYVDYNLSFSFIRGVKLFAAILLLSAVVWGIPYLFKKYISRKL